jgi:hypothetical protein
MDAKQPPAENPSPFSNLSGGFSFDEQAAQAVGGKCCAVCASTQELRKCGQCKSVWYCNVEHQKQHWPSHKVA